MLKLREPDSISAWTVMESGHIWFAVLLNRIPKPAAKIRQAKYMGMGFRYRHVYRFKESHHWKLFGLLNNQLWISHVLKAVEYPAFITNEGQNFSRRVENSE